VGFAQVGSFGGLIETPNIDRLAENGLRYNNFHTTALCSPSHATLMAGRNPHAIGLGSHALTAMGFPGYNAFVPPSAKSVANYLQEAGYVNYALGKWDHTPLYEVSQVGPFDRWPSGEGFNHASAPWFGPGHRGHRRRYGSRLRSPKRTRGGRPAIERRGGASTLPAPW